MWIYKNNGKQNTARFILGEILSSKSKNPLICFGVNCSTAEPQSLDPTVRRVKNIAHAEGFDGWIMLNLYPERMTRFEDLDDHAKLDLHKKNLFYIKAVFKEYPKATVWAAWGGLIMRRLFLKQCLKDIANATSDSNIKWVYRGSLVGGEGHPHHPLYLRNDACFYPFNIKDYLNRI